MMSKNIIKALSLPKAKAVIFALFLAITIIIPSFFHSQWITGPIVNAMLIIATVTIGPMEAILLGLMPSAVALATGLLPLPLAPMVPFIMIGNVVLVVSFYYLRGQNFFLRLGISALFKFAFLHFSVVFIMSALLQNEIVSRLAIMMSWPQFVTAVIGGVIAYPIIKSKR